MSQKWLFGFVLVAGLISSSVSVGATDPSALSQSAKSGSGFNCFDLRKASQKLPVHTANIQNRETTRTAQGGPYKRVDLICREMYCETAEREDFKLIADRSHPDANAAGYVRFPRIDVPSEFAALSAAASEVRLLAQAGACGATAIAGQTMALVKYESGSSIQSDTFNFTADGRLTSWSRVQRDGTSQAVAFNSDGSVSKQ